MVLINSCVCKLSWVISGMWMVLPSLESQVHNWSLKSMNEGAIDRKILSLLFPKQNTYQFFPQRCQTSWHWCLVATLFRKYQNKAFQEVFRPFPDVAWLFALQRLFSTISQRCCAHPRHNHPLQPHKGPTCVCCRYVSLCLKGSPTLLSSLVMNHQDCCLYHKVSKDSPHRTPIIFLKACCLF